MWAVHPSVGPTYTIPVHHMMTVVRLRTGHDRPSYRVYSKRHVSHTEQCPCGTGSLTTEHLLRSCPLYGRHSAVESPPICSILFYSRLCPSTAESDPPPGSFKFFCPLLSLSINSLLPPQCHLPKDVLVFQPILHPLSATLCFDSGDVSSPFPFRIGYALDYVCHSGSLPNGGVADSVF